MNQLSILAVVVILITSLACRKNPHEPNCGNCDQETIVSAALYESAPDDFLHLDTVFIKDDCLNITFTSSGCDGETWVTQLIDSEQILESNPVQRVLRLSLFNEELCDAVFSRTITFDLRTIQLSDYDRLLINLDDWEAGPILYEY